MKKLLSILGAVVLTTTGASGIVSNNIYQKTNLKSGWKKILDVRMFHQLTDWYCGPASIQMILNYFNVNINQYTQDRIYNDLGGRGQEGINPSRNIATYLNNVRTLHGETRGLNYNFEYLESGFGSTQNEMLMFQDYIVQSLAWNAPVMFIYDSGYERHAFVINGIQIDENEPGRTSYNYLEPSLGTRETMTGWDIQNYITNVGNGAALFGVSNNFDFKNKTIKVKNSWEPVKDNFGTYHQENKLSDDKIDLTEAAGITNLEELKKVTSLSLPIDLDVAWGKTYYKSFPYDTWLGKNFSSDRGEEYIKEYDKSFNWWCFLAQSWFSLYYNQRAWVNSINKHFYLDLLYEITGGVTLYSATNIFVKIALGDWTLHF